MKCAQRDFRSSLAPRYRAHFVSAASRTHVRVQDRRKMATKSTPPREQNNHVINSLSVGWGARTRTWEWRNQKSPEQSDLAKLFSRLMVKARMSHQMVMSNFPTGRMVVRQANGKPCRPNPGAPSLRSENLAWPMKARHGPPGVGTVIWTNRAALGANGQFKRDEEPHRGEL
jgi:hypothetical protein